MTWSAAKALAATIAELEALVRSPWALATLRRSTRRYILGVCRKHRREIREALLVQDERRAA